MPAMPKTQFTEPAKRRFAALPANNGMGGKTAKEVWLDDAGTYPVIIIIGGACVFCFSYYAHNIATNPDIRVWKDKRKHTVIRNWEMSSWGHH
mmetsp:Transcript_7227/g.18384  ORF Transcript_7227/g.18384 Transcript_7227/m.18384 type:complete len:93 (-) Transcript_7227:437-715(-)|eukprot:CAMPEP_0119478412 /NCGR_PEP_ID=MMETSP1344-20130328/8165_1 /TAXON_ID=236787 /ORGANISM="Florenciella parvula, Strain CCMP2471" /LENGTH=92 /DNA_ID=CAMNT_0007512585 /DNA_START=300 /DNA_END=578 /DNA_ORIENTATION=+